MMRFFSSLHPKYKTVFWMIAWAFSFSTAMILNKKLGCHIPMTVVVWGRCAFALIFFLPFLRFQNLGHLWGLQVSRGVCISLAMICTYTAYRNIEIHTSSVLGSTAPFFITLFSFLFLKERIYLTQWLLLFLGYSGVLIILGPVHQGVNFYYLVALLGNTFAALATTCGRALAVRNALAQNTIFYGSCIPFILYSFAAFYEWKPLSAQDWMFLVFMGACGGASQWCYFNSLRLSPASFVAPLEYLRLCILIPMSYLLFHEVPCRSFYVGAFLILSASLILVIRRKKA